MEWLTEEVVEKLLNWPYLLALGVVCWIFMRLSIKAADTYKGIIDGLIQVIKEKKD